MNSIELADEILPSRPKIALEPGTRYSIWSWSKKYVSHVEENCVALISELQTLGRDDSGFTATLSIDTLTAPCRQYPLCLKILAAFGQIASDAKRKLCVTRH